MTQELNKEGPEHKEFVLRQVRGAIKSAIHAHGNITPDNYVSAAKRITGLLCAPSSTGLEHGTSTTKVEGSSPSAHTNSPAYLSHPKLTGFESVKHLEISNDMLRLSVAENTALRELLAEAWDAILWCSASQDFQPGGQAEIGWVKLCRPLLAKLQTALAGGGHE